MFSEHGMLHVELNALNRIIVTEMCEIIIAKVDWIRQTIVTHFARYATVNARCVGDFL
jgi:hypothetical protein